MVMAPGWAPVPKAGAACTPIIEGADCAPAARVRASQIVEGLADFQAEMCEVQCPSSPEQGHIYTPIVGAA